MYIAMMYLYMYLMLSNPVFCVCFRQIVGLNVVFNV